MDTIGGRWRPILAAALGEVVGGGIEDEGAGIMAAAAIIFFFTFTPYQPSSETSRSRLIFEPANLHSDIFFSHCSCWSLPPRLSLNQKTAKLGGGTYLYLLFRSKYHTSHLYRRGHLRHRQLDMYGTLQLSQPIAIALGTFGINKQKK